MIYPWAVIGAGPAGIAAIGKLIDQGIEDIVWIDPEFKVGDFGTHWRNVPSNTKVGLFIKFLHASKAFDYKNCPQDFSINHLSQDTTCQLSFMADPLQWVTEQLKEKVHCIKGFAEKLSVSDRTWKIPVNGVSIAAKKVILATGAEPKTLNYPECPVIPLNAALDIEQIHRYLNPNDTIAVFGSSHSAILVLRNLVSYPIKSIINFYRSHLVYAVYLDDGIMFDNTGLKGVAAEWAHENLDNKMPANLRRVLSNEASIQHYLPKCNKVVYATGFETRGLPLIENVDVLNYNQQTGIIEPNLFGLGIAFPEYSANALNIAEYQVGLWKFMNYLERILPLWMNSIKD